MDTSEAIAKNRTISRNYVCEQGLSVLLSIVGVRYYPASLPSEKRSMDGDPEFLFPYT